MNLASRTFRNNKTGEIVKVIDSFENIAILENKGKVNVDDLLNTNLYTEQIDIESFLNPQSTYNTIAETIKNIPLDKIKYDDGAINVNMPDSGFKPSSDESAILMITEDDERAELARKYNIQNDSQDAIKRQNDAFNKILGEETRTDGPIQQIQVKREEFNHIQQKQTPVEDPIVSMFKNVKRTKDFSISLEIKNKIPRLDFIEMMEDSYNVSIIDYLATEFTDELLKNPQTIENMIRDKIKEMVYKPEIKKKIETPLETPSETPSDTKPKVTKKPATRKKESNKNDK